MRPPVRTKRDHSTRYLASEFGNHSPSWSTPNELLYHGNNCPSTEPVPRLFHLRNRSIAGGTTYYNLSWSIAIAKWLEQSSKEDWFVSQMVPPGVENTITIQGEIFRTPDQRTGYVPSEGPCGLQLFYSHLPLPQRQALQKDGRTAYGIMADILLRRYLDPGDREWLLELLDEYPGHVVEFSSYGRRWGTEMKRTVIWECRLY